MKTKLKVLTGLVLLIFLTTSLTLVALAETSTEDEGLFNPEEVGLAPGGVGLLATFNVVTTTDAVDANLGNGVCDTALAGGVCTLRAAIEQANASIAVPDTIMLPSGTYNLTLGDLRITTTIIIMGDGAGSTTINGTGTSRIFRIQSSGVATISGVTLTNGNGSGGANGGGLKGGAIWIFHGVLTLLNSTVTGNMTTGNDGGGIVNEHGTLTINNSTITNNTGFGGGGVSNRDGTATINNTIISGNTASTGGLVNPGIGVGGGVSNVAVTDDSTLTINQSSITGNKATGSGGGGVNNNASDNNTATTTLNQTIVSSNDAIPTNTLINSTTGFGGGIRNGFANPVGNTTASIFVVNNSAISNNKAVNAGGIGNGTQSTASTLTLQMTLNNTTVSGNSTPNHNGGASEGSGGGLVNVNGTLSLVNSTVSGNSATGTDTTGGFGGGLFNGDLNRATTLWLTNTTVTSNTAQASGKGDGVANVRTAGTTTANFKNSILAGGCVNANGGTLSSQGNNLDDDDTCSLTATGDITNTNPLLGSLQSNGGLAAGASGATTPMLTHALLENSQALGGGDQTVCAAAPINNLDQRGVTRPATDPACDIGSFESPLQGPNPVSGGVYLPIVIKG